MSKFGIVINKHVFNIKICNRDFFIYILINLLYFQAFQKLTKHIEVVVYGRARNSHSPWGLWQGVGLGKLLV